MLVELPANVLGQVLDYISDVNELREICSTSRVFRDVSRNRLYKELTIHPHWSNDDLPDDAPLNPTGPPDAEPQVGPFIQRTMLELYSSPHIAPLVRRCFLTPLCEVMSRSKWYHGPHGPLEDKVRKMFIDLDVPITFRNLTHLIISQITVTRNVYIEISRVSNLVRLETFNCPLKNEAEAPESGAYTRTVTRPLDIKLDIREFLVHSVDTLAWLDCLFVEPLHALYFLYIPAQFTPLMVPTFRNVQYLDIEIDFRVLEILQILHRFPNLLRLSLRGIIPPHMSLPTALVTRANLKVYDGPAKLFPFIRSDKLESLTLRSSSIGQPELIDIINSLGFDTAPACNITCLRVISVLINKDLFEAIGSTFKNLKALEIAASEFHRRIGKISTMTLKSTESDVPGAMKLLPQSLEHLTVEWVPPGCNVVKYSLVSPDALPAAQDFKNRLLLNRPGLKSVMVHAGSPKHGWWLKEPTGVVDRRSWPVEFYSLYCAGVCPQALFHFAE